MKFLRLFACLLPVAAMARAQFTATYDFGSSVTDVPSVTNVTFTTLTGTNVSVDHYPDGSYYAQAYTYDAGGSTVNTSEYASITLSADSGYELALTQLTFKESRTGTGPVTMAVGLFVDNALQEMSANITTTQLGPTIDLVQHSFNFSDLSSIAATSTAEFRFYGWGGLTTAGKLRLDDISISGSVAALSAVPEPSTYPVLAGLIVLGVALVRRRAKPIST